MDEDMADRYMEFLDAEMDKKPKIFESTYKRAKKRSKP